MKELVARHRPHALSPQEWQDLWDNKSGLQFEALAGVLKNMQKSLEKVDPQDFAMPNHYEKMVWQAAQVQVIGRILDLLPPIVVDRELK